MTFKKRKVTGKSSVHSRLRLSDELVDQLLAGCESTGDITGPDGLLAQLTGRLVERAIDAELDAHLGYDKGDEPPPDVVDRRNGISEKTLITPNGKVPVALPRGRESDFQPRIVGKHQRRFDGFNDQIISLYGRGMTVRDIKAHLQEIYHTDISPDLISHVTDAIIEDVKEWQTRPLDDVYPILYLDAIVVKIRDNGAVTNRACHIAIGVNLDGDRDVLGFWFAQTEGAKHWMHILTELKKRGVKDILVCCTDGLTGLHDAIEAVFPATWVQTCIVHQIRNSLRFVPYKDKRQVVNDLKQIYTAINQDQAADQLNHFADKWDNKYPMISQSWQDNWERIIPFLAFPDDLRKVIYTTNTIENLNRAIRKTIKTRGHFPNEQAAAKLIYLTIQNSKPNWRTTHRWTQALTALKIQFPNRIN